jgi:hypothetical protein
MNGFGLVVRGEAVNTKEIVSVSDQRLWPSIDIDAVNSQRPELARPRSRL